MLWASFWVWAAALEWGITSRDSLIVENCVLILSKMGSPSPDQFCLGSPKPLPSSLAYCNSWATDSSLCSMAVCTCPLSPSISAAMPPSSLSTSACSCVALLPRQLALSTCLASSAVQAQESMSEWQSARASGWDQWVERRGNCSGGMREPGVFYLLKCGRVEEKWGAGVLRGIEFDLYGILLYAPLRLQTQSLHVI